MNTLKVLCLSLVVSVAFFEARAASFDGSEPLICASVEAYDCGTSSECFNGPAERITAPQFIRLDFEQKLTRATRLGGEERTAKIEKVTREEGKIILQGVQMGLGWSMTIAQESGAMVLTAAGEQVAFVIFGACTPL